MSKTTLLLLVVVALMVSSNVLADVTIGFVSDDVGSGLKRFTFTATSTVPNQFIGGFDMTFTASSMSQQNPFGLPTVFQDNNGQMAAAGLDANKDSQFLYDTGGGADILVASGTAVENATTLSAAFVFTASSVYAPAQSTTFAQIVVPGGTENSIDWSGVVSIANTGVIYEVSGQTPEPATLGLLCLALGALCRRPTRGEG
ncbi:MAG: PEP-CTERM sorting domain-containing protein [Phycisphaeraceae bacterium]|nr:PEP-CTERM sorting domain-containing protein [Phycisphaeraceae bacterium]